MRARLDLALTKAYLDEAERELRRVEERLSAEAGKNGGTGLLSVIVENVTLVRGHVSQALRLLDGKLTG